MAFFSFGQLTGTAFFNSMILGPKYPRFIADKCCQRIMDSSPIIVVGMHRSGTGILSTVLQKSGVFMGRHLTRNNESIFFQSLNRDALDIMGCNWRSVAFFPANRDLENYYAWLTRYMRQRLKSDVVDDHFGLSAWRWIFYQPILWGWKDPRNSILLPKWLQIFPKAKIIHIFRDGRDVALSLLGRDINREKDASFFDDRVKRDRYISYFNLWECYLDRIQSAVKQNSLLHTVKFENLLSEPHQEIEKLHRFLGIPQLSNNDRISSLIDRTRKNRYLQDEFRRLNEVELNKSLLNRLGYQ
jgi:hypothetical protein